ncbi:helix-turn-helix transcriptional regulator [Photobacterium aquimaris]|uniref:Transcriptional regulator n=1 Tax=Photobacterium aquimaris TaxID=512643 RepID=A0A2T3I1U2_9GAMM|nr:metalloregulator ArsR/SmtB family transcription factor [Photobacterium aquimaris]MCP4956886.1 transcriptional regulator [Photobacterium aquimaris]OBU16639.1 transcriptional regulator [Photobacterium aquimaris]PQJ37526.1 transcriptional regulator [Photobacterium aquimaris]PSU11923.1 transcriptional regulator [Photobacterium aquimaris]
MKTIEKILYHIKCDGPVTAKVLADKFQLTTMGIRQHLQTMEEQGLVDAYDVKVKVGRPTRHWQLTSQGHQHFSDHHDELAVQTLDAVNDLFGHQGLQAIINKREQQTLEHYQTAITDCLDLKTKLVALTELRQRDGYMAELICDDNGFLLIENHCPICLAATRCPSLCQSELAVFQQLLGENAVIHRQEHIITGQRRCAYRITSK